MTFHLLIANRQCGTVSFRRQIRRLLNPLLWRRAPVEFQLQLLQTQIGYVRSSLSTAREILSVASILDTIRALYTHDQATERPLADEERGGEGGAEGPQGPVQGEEHRTQSLIRVFRDSAFSQISSHDEFLALTRGAGEVAASRQDKERLRTTALQVRTRPGIPRRTCACRGIYIQKSHPHLKCGAVLSRSCSLAVCGRAWLADHRLPVPGRRHRKGLEVRSSHRHTQT